MILNEIYFEVEKYCITRRKNDRNYCKKILLSHETSTYLEIKKWFFLSISISTEF